MLTIDQAFRKFKSRLELNDKEQDNATARHTEVRDYLGDKFSFDTTFLTGSYARWTKTKPLKDVDIFFVLSSKESDYRSKHPSVVLGELHRSLNEKYGDKAKRQNRSINVEFGIHVDAEDNTNYRVVSVDVVPAFEKDGDYEIPDESLGRWIKTNPKIHAEKATAAHQAYASEWKGLVRMVKYWNNNPKHGEKAIKPSFLIEVMALQCLHGGWGGSFDREVQGLFATMADRVFDVWPDPAGLGPAISDGMDSQRKARARELLLMASRTADLAVDHVRRGRRSEALQVWRELFGPKFPLT